MFRKGSRLLPGRRKSGLAYSAVYIIDPDRIIVCNGAEFIGAAITIKLQSLLV